jgi:predicted aconitase
MFLTEDEKRMRDGAEGDAVAAAMDLLIRSRRGWSPRAAGTRRSR